MSEIAIFFRMYVPIMRSTYGAAMTVTFMNAWNNYLWPKVILQDNASITMPMLVANLKSGYSVDYGMLMLADSNHFLLPAEELFKRTYRSCEIKRILDLCMNL